MQVPNTDSIDYADKEIVILQPRGHWEDPKTEKELLEAIFCILQVLKVSTIWIQNML